MERLLIDLLIISKASNIVPLLAQQYLAVFHVHVILRNDETPTRAVDKVFHVVEGGQKLLTGDDLRFVDLDIDTRPEDIRYNHHSIPNGELVLVDKPSEAVFHFTQKEARHWGNIKDKVESQT